MIRIATTCSRIGKVAFRQGNRRSFSQAATHTASATFPVEDRTPVKKKPSIKPWLQTGRNVQSRYQDLIAASSLHPGDFSDPSMQDLIKQCCMLQSLEGMKMVQDILDKLIVEKRKQQTEKGSEYMIHERFFTTAIYGWVNMASSVRVAQNRMRELLDLAIQEAEHDAEQFSVPKEYLPTIQLYNTYLQGLSNAAKLTSQAAVTAEATLYEMSQYHSDRGWHTKPNSRSFSLVLTAFAHTAHKASGDRAMDLLRRIHDIHDQELAKYERVVGECYNLTNPDANKWQIVTPDAAIYTSAMKAIIPSKPEKAIELLEDAVKKGVKMDAGMFIMPIKAMAVSVDKETNGSRRFVIATQAEELLQNMIELWNSGQLVRNPKKDEKVIGFQGSNFLSVAYNACLDVWSKSYCREAPVRCEAILNLMLSDETGPDVQPTFVTFNSCIYSWYKSIRNFPDAAERAEELLRRQMQLALPNASPDFQSYAIVINTYAKSDDPWKLQKSMKLLQEMIAKVADGSLAMSRNPTAPFTAVLGTCARTTATPKPASNEFTDSVDTKTDPYSIANETYYSIRTDSTQMGTTVDHHAASAFIRCVARHCPRGSVERENAVRMAFEDACANGQVSRIVVDGMKDALGEKRLNEIYPDLLNKAKRPRIWSQNVSGLFR